MNPKRILLALSLALFVSGVSTWFFSRRLTAPPSTQKRSDVFYVAPSRALEAGEVIKPGDTELVAWPGTHPIQGGVRRASDLVGREALFPLAKDQPILDHELSAAGSGTGLASKIPDGMRAVTLRSDEVVGVAGFLNPGSHLDVLVTYHANGSPEPLTATVLQNVVVIAAGHQLEPAPTGKTSDVTIVTLLLTPDESERAVLAGTQGLIHFILRNAADTEVSARNPILLSQLAGRLVSPQKPAPGAAPARAAAKVAMPIRHGIETVLGGSPASAAVEAVPGGVAQ